MQRRDDGPMMHHLFLFVGFLYLLTGTLTLFILGAIMEPDGGFFDRSTYFDR